MDKLIDCNLSADELKDVVTACGKLSGLPIYTCDDSTVTPSIIRRDVLSFKNVKAVVMDYIGLMESDKKFRDSRTLEISTISRNIKVMAKELNIPFIVLSQLNREKDEKTEPTLRDLRDSGSLEQDADKVIFLWEIEAFDDGTKIVGASVAKNKRGRLGAVKMEFNGAYMEFTEVGYITQEERTKPKKTKRGNAVFGAEGE